MAGSVIAAALITGLNSDLPGQVVAQVTENVYDTVTGRFLLIPQGTRLIGKYDSHIAYGQERLLPIWTRLVMPDGSSIVLDNLPATDTQGYAGLEDGVDYHTWRLLKGVMSLHCSAFRVSWLPTTVPKAITASSSGCEIA